MTDSVLILLLYLFENLVRGFLKSFYKKFDNSLQGLSRLGDCFKDSVCTFLIRTDRLELIVFEGDLGEFLVIRM